MKIAILVGETFNGGVGMAMMNYFRHIDHSLFSVDFFVNQEPSKELRADIKSSNGRVILIPSRKNMIRYIWVLYGIFRQGNYDVVHSNLTTLNLFPLFAAKLAGVKKRIAHCHSSSNPTDKISHLIKTCLKPFARLFATEYFTCGIEAGKWLFGKRLVESGRVKLIRNAIDLDKFKFDSSKRDEIRGQYNLHDKFVLGHIGRISKQKNHAFLIKCFNEVLKINPNARLLLVGDGELYWDVKVEISLLGIADKVIFTGNSSNASDYYNAMDVFLFPSLFEGLSVVLVEAQANGLPCLVSTNNSPESKITDVLNFMSLTETPESWARACVCLQRNMAVDVQSQIATAGYDITSAAKELEKVYLEMLC